MTKWRRGIILTTLNLVIGKLKVLLTWASSSAPIEPPPSLNENSLNVRWAIIDLFACSCQRRTCRRKRRYHGILSRSLLEASPQPGPECRTHVLIENSKVVSHCTEVVFKVDSPSFPRTPCPSPPPRPTSRWFYSEWNWNKFDSIGFLRGGLVQIEVKSGWFGP